MDLFFKKKNLTVMYFFNVMVKKNKKTVKKHKKINFFEMKFFFEKYLGICNYLGI